MGVIKDGSDALPPKSPVDDSIAVVDPESPSGSSVRIRVDLNQPPRLHHRPCMTGAAFRRQFRPRARVILDIEVVATGIFAGLNEPPMNVKPVEEVGKNWPDETVSLYWNPYANPNVANIMRTMNLFLGLGLGAQQQGIRTCIEPN